MAFPSTSLYEAGGARGWKRVAMSMMFAYLVLVFGSALSNYGAIDHSINPARRTPFTCENGECPRFMILQTSSLRLLPTDRGRRRWLHRRRVGVLMCLTHSLHARAHTPAPSQNTSSQDGLMLTLDELVRLLKILTNRSGATMGSRDSELLPLLTLGVLVVLRKASTSPRLPAGQEAQAQPGFTRNRYLTLLVEDLC